MKTDNQLQTQNQSIVLNDPKANAERTFDRLDISDLTRQDYKYRIGYFLDYTQKNGVHHDTYLEFKRHIANRTDWSIATKNKYLATAKIFLKELNRQGLLPMDITQNIKSFSQSKKHKRDGLNDEEMTKLVEKMQQLPSSPQNSRLRAMVSLLALQGLRQIEIVRLDVKDIDSIGKTALVQGKGRDDKEPIDLHPETVKAIKEYLKMNKKASGALFTSVSNNHKNERLTTRAVRDIITGFLKELGVDKSTHGFRHYFTTKLIKTYKGDLLEVAQYTRHRGLEMLQVYNDAVKKEADLPRYYDTFSGISFSK